jgi:oxygen-dependent protoporphyrinogen oxidase
MTSPRRVVIIGGGITGLTTAFTLASTSTSPIEIQVLEASDRFGGLIRTSPFAGIDAVDEGADAFLSRVPWAVDLASELGLSGALTSPSSSHAWVWHNELHRIPGDIMLGIPASVSSFARSKLFSPRGKIRALGDVLLPRTTNNDCIGSYVRRRFGNEIHERLVDPLIGSIYAADTDNFSMESVPQIHALTKSRSMLLAARKMRTKTAIDTPVFKTPLRGVGSLISTLEQKIAAQGVQLISNAAVAAISRHDFSYLISSSQGQYAADAVVLTSPAAQSASFTKPIHEDIATTLSRWDHADVILVTLAIPRSQWSSDTTGSGYLVPKPDQRWITAVSFGSNKWSHWKNESDEMILRVSLGRDGVEVLHLSDDEILNLTLADLKMHLGQDFSPTSVRISRWENAFPQYRPHHFQMLINLEKLISLHAPGIHLAGASYRGIGIPACIQQAREAAKNTLEYLSLLAD